MALNIDELRPKKFKITLGGQETECEPAKMAHLFMINKIGSVFREPEKASTEQIKEADQYFIEIVADLIPELQGVDIGIEYKLELLEQLAEKVIPADNKELADKGVSFDKGPKVKRAG